MLAGVACGLCAGVATVCAQPTALGQAQQQRISVWGIPAPDDGGTATADGRSGGRRTVRGIAVERMRLSDSNMQRAAADPSRPDGAAGRSGTGVEITDLSYRWGVANRNDSMDVGVGAGTYHLLPGSSGAGSLPYAGGVGFGADGRREIVVPTVSVGVRHRLSDQHKVDLYASGSASLASPAVGEFYTAKVKVEWLPTKNSGIGLEQAAVNMKFSANSNFSLRVRGGGPMLYYRSKF